MIPGRVCMLWLHFFGQSVFKKTELLELNFELLFKKFVLQQAKLRRKKQS